MIKPLLEYQAKEKEKLTVQQSVEQGRAKRELDEGNRVIENSKRMLLGLENDARILLATYESVSKNLNEIFAKIAEYNKSANESSSEEEASAALNFVSGLLGKVGAYEQQLSDITNKINAKTAAFEDAKMQVVKAQKAIQTHQAEYEKQKNEIKPQVDKIDAELAVLAEKVDKGLLEKYKRIRKNDTTNRVSDIAVPLADNRCGGCYFELPLSLIHTIGANGFILCEECGKIIYK